LDVAHQSACDFSSTDGAHPKIPCRFSNPKETHLKRRFPSRSLMMIIDCICFLKSSAAVSHRSVSETLAEIVRGLSAMYAKAGQSQNGRSGVSNFLSVVLTFSEGTHTSLH
jgi:hypothetical protein